jgi:hypothetical protein
MASAGDERWRKPSATGLAPVGLRTQTRQAADAGLRVGDLMALHAQHDRARMRPRKRQARQAEGWPTRRTSIP